MPPDRRRKNTHRRAGRGGLLGRLDGREEATDEAVPTASGGINRSAGSRAPGHRRGGDVPRCGGRQGRGPQGARHRVERRHRPHGSPAREVQSLPRRQHGRRARREAPGRHLLRGGGPPAREGSRHARAGDGRPPARCAARDVGRRQRLRAAPHRQAGRRRGLGPQAGRQGRLPRPLQGRLARSAERRRRQGRPRRPARPGGHLPVHARRRVARGRGRPPRPRVRLRSGRRHRPGLHGRRRGRARRDRRGRRHLHARQGRERERPRRRRRAGRRRRRQGRHRQGAVLGSRDPRRDRRRRPVGQGSGTGRAGALHVQARQRRPERLRGRPVGLRDLQVRRRPLRARLDQAQGRPAAAPGRRPAERQSARSTRSTPGRSASTSTAATSRSPATFRPAWTCSASSRATP